MLLDQANPYRPRLPEVLHLDWADFDSRVSAANDQALGREAEWSVVAYMAANCDLAHCMFDNLLELKSIASTSAMHVCVLFAGPLITDTFFARLNPGGKLSDDVIFRFSGINSSDPRILTMAIKCANIFPARRRLAFLSGHGRGWKGALLNQNLANAFVQHPERLKAPGNGFECQARIFNSLKLTQDYINKRLDSVPPAPQGKMDVLAFDACYMGNLEVVTGLMAEARLFVVTEGRAPGEGFPYEKILAELNRNPAQTSEDIARYILQVNREKYDGGNFPLRQTALISERLVPLSEALANLTRQLDLGDSATFSSVQAAMEQSAALGGTGNIDFKEFVTALFDGSLPSKSREASAAVLEQFARLDLSSNSSSPATDGGGLSIYGPRPEDFDISYLRLSPHVSPLREWIRFLADYCTRILTATSASDPVALAIKAEIEQQRVAIGGV